LAFAALGLLPIGRSRPSLAFAALGLLPIGRSRPSLAFAALGLLSIGRSRPSMACAALGLLSIARTRLAPFFSSLLRCTDPYCAMSIVPPITPVAGRIRAPALLAFVALLVAACARQPAQVAGPDAAAWNARRERLSEIRDWQFRGRIAVQLPREAWSATVYWRQISDTYTLRVMAPLGRGTFELSGSAAGVELRTADNRLLRAADPDSLLRENLGLQLPVSGLHWWVRGLPHPDSGAPNLAIGAAGELERLAQDGWRVEYRDYRLQGDVTMPGRVNLENGNMRVRILINEWRVAL
ncbi:MAG: outer membrane lipoprotein LolB, partial [Gammaproteobacteria bacterium]|nr:outer membrane lipoprotein LolB [Gammaproteobacteria bacterium]